MVRKVYSEDIETQKLKDIELPNDGPVAAPESIEIQSEATRWKDKAKNLAFMEEMVDVTILDNGNDEADQFITLFNNGRIQVMERGVPKKIKRKFVEVLARAKRRAIKTLEYTNANRERAIKIQQTNVMRHPFSVNEDTKEGLLWLKKVLAEPQ